MCINKIKTQLENTKASIVLGIDGMIDEVWELIENRESSTDFSKITRMSDFGNSIIERKTGGFAKERILKRRVGGGFVCNTGRTVNALGLKTSMVGMFGRQQRDSVFDEFDCKVELFSLGEPAKIHILEFADGKIMMPNLESLINLSWNDIISKYSIGELGTLFNKDIVGLGYWSNIYDYENIFSNIVGICRENEKTKSIFHDLANVDKRSQKALLHLMQILYEQDKILPQSLSLNEHEGGILCKALNIDYPFNINSPTAMNYAVTAVEKLRNCVDIEEIIIHSSYFTVASSRIHGTAYAMQNYCDNPVITTGAGDVFNSGYMLASMTDVSLEDRLRIANATTLHYVSTGQVPNRQQVVEQLVNNEQMAI